MSSATNKILLLSVLFITSLNAKDVPIVESLALNVASNEKSIIEFPFKITSMSPPDDFIPERGTQGGAPEILKGENTLEIHPSGSGSTKTIVWGYDHPIFLEIKIEKGGDRYYRFTDPIGRNIDIKDLETNTHEDVIVELITAAFNETAPKGYTTKTSRKAGESGGIKWELQLEYAGQDYAVQTWKMVNNGKEEVELYEEMFASEKSKIYGISIEAPRLKSGEATRVFIVKKNI